MARLGETGLEEAIEQGKITHMSNYIKVPKADLDDVEGKRSGPMPYEMPDQQEESKPSMNETADTIVTPTDTNNWEAEVPLSSSETWEQFRHVMAKEVPITLAAKPCQSPNNKKSTRHRLQNEYVSGFPGLLKSVNNNEREFGDR